eukprot:6201813-Pleurochrysis_carterae.AAC.3
MDALHTSKAKQLFLEATTGNHLGHSSSCLQTLRCRAPLSQLVQQSIPKLAHDAIRPELTAKILLTAVFTTCAISLYAVVPRCRGRSVHARRVGALAHACLAVGGSSCALASRAVLSCFLYTALGASAAFLFRQGTPTATCVRGGRPSSS